MLTWITHIGQVCGDDEYECNTINGTFTFPNESRCIPTLFVCDYDRFNFPIPDCPLGDDEWDCSSCGNNHTVILSGLNQTVNDYICPTTGICIPFEWSCAFGDGIVDCYPNQEDVSQQVCEETNEDYIGYVYTLHIQTYNLYSLSVVCIIFFFTSLMFKKQQVEQPYKLLISPLVYCLLLFPII